ncbi:MAG: DUF502 domain-containing protein [Arenibacter sp.]|jgi:uncharacterized membrane protein|uniref:DUF502 domain-containing protein n=1 Tax=Arenibacter algicola TaxID=616991 RepID=A0A221URC4_9FLAO|nr:DUF502 domain-containing protein [Arenibacter algicola]ASO03738.1 hypothetical protein AREALGSMS7_00240 [Arenibacter algicola]|tara:strand:+ start:6274 stop:6873 length:600 start_codon:yes stop_codon:yes gene_type:complete
MKRLVNYFLQGLLYIAPLGITAYIIYVIFNFIDNLLDDKLEEIFKIDVPGLGFAVIFLFLVLVGIIGQSIFARPFKVLFKRIIEKAPLLKLIFSALNDLFSAFVGKEKKFNKPVMVLVNPISNLEKLGFLTEEDLSILDEKEKVAVYFPHSYNFSGELFIVPRNQVRVIDVNPSVVMKFIISGGVSGIYEERETVNDIE